LAVLEPLRQQMDEKCWQDEQLKIMILQAVAHDADGEKNKAMQQLAEALALAEPEGFIRIFADEGLPMEHLLSEAATRGMMPDCVSKLLAVFEVEKQEPVSPPAQALVDPLSERELEILTLIAAGLKNKEIAAQLFISLNTVLYHVKNIYSKLGVKKRTLAIIKARELNLLPAE
jgi:LuxR family maltose regulon positive regulatory protein